MSKILYIVNNTNLLSGGGVINCRNEEALKSVLSNHQFHVLRFSLDIAEVGIFRKIDSRLRGRFLPKQTTDIIYAKIEELKPDIVIICNSMFGDICHQIKKIAPHCKIVTFFHNIEYDYAKAAAKGTLKSLYYPYIFHTAERKTAKWSDAIWVMNERDNKRLKELYNRESDLVLPTSFEDRNTNPMQTQATTPLRLLFVGFNFFANVEGVKWLVNNVMPALGQIAHLNIVGKNMEEFKTELENHNVSVIGTVDNIDSWYHNSDVVVLPIFSGSGMKTKTAEAMMFAKPIIATQESFEGYDIENHDSIGALCNSAQDFIDSIKNLAQNHDQIKLKGVASREIFLKSYSIESTKTQLTKFFNHCLNQPAKNN